jgi:translocation and assembly module TamB
VALRWDSAALARQTVSFTTRLIRSAPTSGKSPNPDAAPDIGGWTWPESALARPDHALPQLACGRSTAGAERCAAPCANIAISGTAARRNSATSWPTTALRSVVDGFEFGSGKLRARLDGTRLRINEFTLYGAGSAAAF